MVDQIGLRTRSTSGVSIAATGSEPSSGKAYLIIDLSHSCRCLRLVHEVSLSLIKPFTQSANVMALASAAFSAAMRARLLAMGSMPSRRSLLASRAFSRASASVSTCTGPIPMSRARPATTYL